MSFEKPLRAEYNDFTATYVDRVQGDVWMFMDATHTTLNAIVGGLSEVHAEARPAPGEWSIKEIIGHICDTERIFAYRALRFARGDQTPLPGFDQNPYVPAGNFNARKIANLLAELDAVRAATRAFFMSCPSEALLRIGTASGNIMSARAWLYAIAGHESHHLESIRTVYLGR